MLSLALKIKKKMSPLSSLLQKLIQKLVLGFKVSKVLPSVSKTSKC